MTPEQEQIPYEFMYRLRRLSDIKVDNSISLEPGVSVTWTNEGARGCRVELIEYCTESDREIGRISMYARRTALVDIDGYLSVKDVHSTLARASRSILGLIADEPTLR